VNLSSLLLGQVILKVTPSNPDDLLVY